MIRIERTDPAECWRPEASGIAVLETDPIGFAGAAEDERHKWLAGFRRLLDGLDAPLQVVIDVEPGGQEHVDGPSISPADFDDMRGADLAFVDEIRRSRDAHRVTTSLITPASSADRLVRALTDMGIRSRRVDAAASGVFGRERATDFLHARGFSRIWYVDRLPGMELDPGWLFRLLPSGLSLHLAWHATPLPAAWIVGYLQRQLINMRASRLVDVANAASDPALAGALPNAEDLQRRLASSQDKAFHVSIYLTLTTATPEELDAGSAQVDSAARAVLCDVQRCTFRMRDGFLATQPGGPDRLQRKRVLDSTTLVTFFPWNEPDLQQQRGLFVGRNRATGAPVLIDPFDHRRHANANALA